MTIGFWQAEAHQALQSAATAMGTDRPGTAADINAFVGARSDVFDRLARVTELLVGERPVPEMDRAAATTLILNQHEQALTKLYVGLRAATVVERRYPSASGAITTEPARSLRRAADAIGVMNDILASHVPPGHRPRTPEGIAIRAGGGVQAVLGDVAELTASAVLIDSRLPAWLARADGSLAEMYRPLAETARWSVNSRLETVVRELVAGSDGQVSLRELDVARPPIDPAPEVRTVNQADAAITAARTWLWQHPDQFAGAHLQYGTQLGLAVHVLGGSDRVMIDSWRRAARAAVELRATPPSGPAQTAAGELTEALRWAESLLNPRRAGQVQRPVRQLARLNGELPFLAATLRRGLFDAVRRRDLFLPGEAILQRPSGSLVHRATQRWRPATAEDVLVQSLGRALAQGYQADLVGGLAGVAARAFPRLSRSTARKGESTSGRPEDRMPSQVRGRSHDSAAER